MDIDVGNCLLELELFGFKNSGVLELVEPGWEELFLDLLLLVARLAVAAAGELAAI